MSSSRGDVWCEEQRVKGRRQRDQIEAQSLNQDGQTVAPSPPFSFSTLSKFAHALPPSPLTF